MRHMNQIREIDTGTPMDAVRTGLALPGPG